MNKILLISQREYISRVTKKTFLLTTVLLPLFIFVCYAAIIYFSVSQDKAVTIAIADGSDLFGGSIDGKDDIAYRFVPGETEASLKQKTGSKEIDGYVWLPQAKDPGAMPAADIQLVSGKSLGLLVREKIQKQLGEAMERRKLLKAMNITKAELDSMQQGAKLRFTSLEGKEESEAKVGAGYAVGYASGMLIYIVLFVYGTMVMRGVMEEKTSRIAEVIISSVKPFQLMAGKILGIGAVGLTQFLIWIGLTVVTKVLLPMVFPFLSAGHPNMAEGAKDVFGMVRDIDFGIIGACFVFYFLGGYFLYSALFAAVGSAVNEDPQDAQGMMLPITMPVIISIVIMTKAVNDPTGSLAVFGSLFPLTSPIVMMARVPFGVPVAVPYWQLAVSMALLIGGFLGTTWFSARIYRVGILMYGKKAGWKELLKWSVSKQ